MLQKTVTHSDLRFILLIKFWAHEQCDPGKDEEGQHVEPGTDVGQQPQGETELDRVHHVLDQEQAAELGGELVEGAGHTR